MRLDRFLKKRFPKLPPGLIHKLGRKRGITVNRRRGRPETRLEQGDRVQVWEDLSRYEVTAEELLESARRVRATSQFRSRFRLLYEDSSILALNKPAGMVVHPAPRHHHGDTLLDLLRAHLPLAFARGSEFRPAFVHRLDRGTSGVLVAAKTRAAATHLEGVLRRGEARKVYLALVHGRLRQDEGEVRLRIEKTKSARAATRYRAARATEHETNRGRSRPALTRYRVERRFKKATLLRVEIHTGRTHQVRVHMAALGHPLLGDGEYGKKEVNRHYRQLYGLRRVCLHASALEIPLPDSGERRTFRAPLPPDFARVLEGLSSAGERKST